MISKETARLIEKQMENDVALGDVLGRNVLDMNGMNLCAYALDVAAEILKRNGSVVIRNLAGDAPERTFTTQKELDDARWAIAASCSNASLVAC